MQWQHGSWVQNANGSLSLTPIGVDGRQLMSTPCDYDKGIYTRYNQSELFKVCTSTGKGKRCGSIVLNKMEKPAIPSSDGSIPQHRPTESLAIRRHADAASLRRLQASSDASYHDTQPDDNRQSYWQGQAGAGVCARGTAELEEQVRATHGRLGTAHQP